MFEKCLLQVITISFIVFSVIISETNSLKGKNGKCVQENACKCTFPNGMYYDISQLRDVNLGWLKLDEISDLFFTPCKNAIVIDTDPGQEANKGCRTGNGVTLCIRSKLATPKYLGLDLSSTEFESNDENDHQNVSLKFEKILESKRITININLVCDASASLPQLKVISSSRAKDDKFFLQLSSPESCLKNVNSVDGDDDEISTGSKLIIIFLVLFSAYFGGGILALKYIRGAEGFEMIPNYEFWSDLPYLVRDGVLFLVSGFQIAPSYDRI